MHGCYPAQKDLAMLTALSARQRATAASRDTRSMSHAESAQGGREQQARVMTDPIPLYPDGDALRSFMLSNTRFVPRDAMSTAQVWRSRGDARTPRARRQVIVLNLPRTGECSRHTREARPSGPSARGRNPGVRALAEKTAEKTIAEVNLHCMRSACATPTREPFTA